MPLADLLASTWARIQGDLFPWLDEEVGPLHETHRRLVTVLELVRIEAFIASWAGLPGRPPCDRRAIAASFVAKAVLGLPTTAMLIERLSFDKTLRRLVGYQRLGAVPSEATFSRAFAEFAAMDLPGRVHEALIKRTHNDRLVGHVSRDATAIEARERPRRREKPAKAKRRRGRPRKGEVVERKPPRRLERQMGESLASMLADLPRACDLSAKRNARGHTDFWVGYKLHMDVADGDIPVACLLTSASLNDSQAAIPLAHITAGRLTNLYDLMDSAYAAPEIVETSRALGHVPIIAVRPPPGGKAAAEQEALARLHANFRSAEDRRFGERTAAERVNASLKDNYGARFVRVRGHAKVFCHLMFGVLALSAEQIMRLIL